MLKLELLLESLSGNGDLERKPFAYLDGQDNYTFTFEPGFNDSTVFPGSY